MSISSGGEDEAIHRRVSADDPISVWSIIVPKNRTYVITSSTYSIEIRGKTRVFKCPYFGQLGGVGEEKNLDSPTKARAVEWFLSKIRVDFM